MRHPQPFDPVTMPLDGIRLVEASAGTGKTHSLAGLYLRLIVEQGLDVREILVMTFTRAAAQELRERLRERLAHAAAVAAGPPAKADDNPTAFAEAVIGSQPDRAALATRLQEAATRIDQATITTIHGFAQRAAGENAFESALPFDRGEQTDDPDIQREAAADYWRARVFADDAEAAAAFLELWPTPEALFGELRAVLDRPHARLLGPDPEALADTHRQARERWAADRDAFVALLEQARDRDAARANEALAPWLADPGPAGLAERIDRGLAGTSDGFPALPEILCDLASEAAVHAVAKKQPAKDWFRPQELPSVPLLADLQRRGRIAATERAAASVRERGEALKRERRLYSFQDMIDGLHDALADPQGGRPLARALRRTWPWALVDEFQDTDPVQYAILRRLYDDAGSEAGGLILIGDPKQAIYGFRGGDVFAYLDAAGDANGIYGMDTNFRSAPPVLNGLDAVFRQAGSKAFVLDGIAYRSVQPGRAADDYRLTLDGAPIDGLTAWDVPEANGTSKQDVQPRLAAATVTRITALLDGDRAGLLSSDGDVDAVQPADIAVLVNTNQEAAGMQAALTSAGVPAVCIQPASVFAQGAARDILWLLQAAAAPHDRERLRRALTTPLFGYRIGDLAALETDGAAWHEVTETFQQAHRRWHRHGVQAMADPLLQAGAARVMTRPDGERCMTDYLHILERLQAAEHEVFGLDGLIDWLERAIAEAGDGEIEDADRLRLDNEGDLVRVTTVHKAKGLQYPIVFAPYTPWLGTSGNPGQPPLAFHDDANRAVIDLGGDETANRDQALREHRAEQVRSLYVALTRAEQACFFAWGAFNGAADGALAWLLHQADGVEAGTWHGSRKCPDWLDASVAEARLNEASAASAGGLRVEPLPTDEVPSRLTRRERSETLGEARQDLPAPRPPWSVFSFSGLAGQLESAGEPAAGADDADEPGNPAEPEPAAPEIMQEPRGPGFGQAVHDLLETETFAAWPATGVEASKDQHRRVGLALRRHGVDTSADPGVVARTADLVARTLHTPLAGIGPLANLRAHQTVAEMAFFLRLGGASGDAVTTAMAGAGYGPRGGIEDANLRGLMQGFIDLVVEADGRYWVLDYKTNALGPYRRDYDRECLVGAIRRHHYDLQYLIYMVALHRYLNQRLPNYDPTTHLGGVQYLFVRGMAPAEPASGVHVDRVDPALVEELDRLFDGPNGRP